jgi:cbb3-type cytochrome oxidase subunit 3
VLAQTVVLGALYRVLDSWLTRVMSALFVLVAGCLLMSALFKGIEVLLGISLLLALTALAAWFAAVWYLYFRLQRKGKTAYVEFPESSTG